MNSNRAVLIDGNSLIFRAFYALPPLTNKEGIATNAVYGFFTMFFKILDEYDPEFVSVSFDKKGKTFRHRQYEAYKAGRKETPNELLVQFPIVKEILDVLNIHRIEMDDYEADDLVSTLTKECEKENLEILIVTGDRDYLQLVSEKTKVLLTRKGISQVEKFDEEHMMETYGMNGDTFVHLKALMGDSSDNIPGVPGVGEKTGIKLLKAYNTLDGIYENIDLVKGKLKEKLADNEASAYMSYKMSLMVSNLPIDFSKELISRKEFDKEKTREILTKYDLHSLTNRFLDSSEDEEIEFTIIDNENINLLDEFLSKEKEFFFKGYGNNLNTFLDKRFFIIADKDSLFYIDILKLNNEEEFFKILEKAIEAKNRYIGYDTKSDWLFLKSKNIHPKIYGDAEIAEYLIHSSDTNYSLDKLAEKYIGKQIDSFETLLGKGKKAKNLDEISENERILFLVSRIDGLRRIYKIQKEYIEERKMEKLYYDIELPLIEVLASMQEIGFKVDKDKLIEIGKGLDKELEQLEKQIYFYSGSEFNINSPKQLGVVLFEVLKLPVIKKNKTGYSTASDVLEKLLDKHPIVADISMYRQLIKLKGTYIDGLIKVIDKDGRIHSSFMQTVASTGRISSTEPNLQNIPVRTAQGREIRKVFVPKDDSVLIDADYSQIELRVLASLANDPKMVKAFNENMDIHSQTAAEVFDIELSKVTKEMRSRAKAVNFGIVYGISDFGLSRDLNIPVKESKKLIDNYFETYPDIEKYLKSIIENAKENGYAETMFNRKRDLPELKSSNYNIRSFGERVAMNMPIQGTAADIIKIAMIKVYKELKQRKLKSKLILQVHDELIIETYKEEVSEVTKLLTECMEEAIVLKVKLEVDLKVGNSWYETK